MHEPLRASRYYAKASESLVIQADDSRKQADNAELCWQRFHQLLKGVASSAVPGTTSDYQKSKVKKLYVPYFIAASLFLHLDDRGWRTAGSHRPTARLPRLDIQKPVMAVEYCRLAFFVGQILPR